MPFWYLYPLPTFTQPVLFPVAAVEELLVVVVLPDFVVVDEAVDEAEDEAEEE